ncbi:hypothetical protein [Escherichia coli]|nr:hypothetical protein [Escherichia coli]
MENKLKLKVNEKKSAVARPWEWKFLDDSGIASPAAHSTPSPPVLFVAS